MEDERNAAETIKEIFNRIRKGENTYVQSFRRIS
jgi:hypothetical protein